jgi:hypothetical protein
MQSLKIERLNLVNVGPFNELELVFRSTSGISLICGDNGIGKTSILEAIASCFSFGNHQRIRKRADTEKGIVTIEARVDGSLTKGTADLTVFGPNEKKWFSILPQFSRSVINIRATRDFSYQQRDAIGRDPIVDENNSAQRVGLGLDTNEIKHWFSNRFLMKPHATEGGWTSSMRDNLESAISFFSILDSSVRLNSVDVRSFDIVVDTPSGKLPFEYLSSGFRSAYVLFLGILKEIEFRGVDVAAKDFTGLILIDEIDLHLHPTWQRMIAGALTTAFPQAQFIATTHSPHVIQAAQASEVIALSRALDGRVRPRELPSTRFGYAGWTLDEVLEDVMGVPDTKSPLYRSAVSDFDDAIANDDAGALVQALDVLREMLHPNNPYRKLIEIQAAPVIGNAE